MDPALDNSGAGGKAFADDSLAVTETAVVGRLLNSHPMRLFSDTPSTELTVAQPLGSPAEKAVSLIT
jgi:hypothetical protein